jgi:peptidyl-prolyl cis-trans isomerase D
MVRRLAVLSFVVLAGCSGLRDAISAHQDVVAQAGGQVLTVNHLAELIAPVKNVPLRREVVDRVAEMWVDWQLLGQAAAVGDSLLDSATVTAANWPAMMQRLADRLHDTMIVSRARVTPRQVDSAYNAGNVRWLSHILVTVRQDTTPQLKEAKRREAAGILAQLQRGADFAKLAEQKSQDPGSAKNGGALGLVARGQMVKAFEDAAWGLQPGELSQPVESPFGWHIIWRPRLEQVRDSFTARLKDLMVAHLDSAYLDSLKRQTGIQVKSSAPSVVRAAAANLRDAKTSSRVLATYNGGQLTERDFARWLEAYPANTRGAIPQAPDTALSEFVRSIAVNDMLIHSAEARHIRLTAEDRDSVREQYRRDLARMEDELGVAPDSLAADSAAKQSRAEAAGRRVDAYFAQIVSGGARRQFFEVPPFLGDVLRERFAWRVSPVGVDRALEKARDLRGPTAQGGVPMMTPAPSGPPVGTQPPGGRSQQPAPGGQKRR